jgi:hypothetical protein
MDKIGAYTGPGKVSENVLKKPKMIVSANLFNYNTDGNMLKAEHKAWIDSKLIPLLRQFRAHVELTGTASLGL